MSGSSRVCFMALHKMFAELNEKYDSEFVGPPL
jgi:hypothetical protein